jgi:hypothetical protein
MGRQVVRTCGRCLTTYAHQTRLVNCIDGTLAAAIDEDLKEDGLSLSADEVHDALEQCHRVALWQASQTD